MGKWESGRGEGQRRIPASRDGYCLRPPSTGSSPPSPCAALTSRKLPLHHRDQNGAEVCLAERELGDERTHFTISESLTIFLSSATVKGERYTVGTREEGQVQLQNRKGELLDGTHSLCE